MNKNRIHFYFHENSLYRWVKLGNWSLNVDPSSLCCKTWNYRSSHARNAARPIRLTCTAPTPTPGECVTGLSFHEKSVLAIITFPFMEFSHLNLSSTCFPCCPSPTMNLPPFCGLYHIFIFISKCVGAHVHPLPQVFRSAHVRDGFSSMKPRENPSSFMRNWPVPVKWHCVTSPVDKRTSAHFLNSEWVGDSWSVHVKSVKGVKFTKWRVIPFQDWRLSSMHSHYLVNWELSWRTWKVWRRD